MPLCGESYICIPYINGLLHIYRKVLLNNRLLKWLHKLAAAGRSRQYMAATDSSRSARPGL